MKNRQHGPAATYDTCRTPGGHASDSTTRPEVACRWRGAAARRTATLAVPQLPLTHMTGSVDALLADLETFHPTEDGADNVHRLNELLAGFDALPGCERVAPALLALLERHPQADFGTPGPLVHALESQAGYPGLLAASLERQPTELTAWMANRLLNSKLPREERAAWLRHLTVVTSHPRAAAGVRDSAIRFLDFQASRQGR